MTQHRARLARGLCARCGVNPPYRDQTCCANCRDGRHHRKREASIARGAILLHCGNCGEEGHNRRGCPEPIAQPAPIPRDPQAADAIADEVLP